MHLKYDPRQLDRLERRNEKKNLFGVTNVNTGVVKNTCDYEIKSQFDKGGRFFKRPNWRGSYEKILKIVFVATTNIEKFSSISNRNFYPSTLMYKQILEFFHNINENPVLAQPLHPMSKKYAVAPKSHETKIYKATLL